MSQRLAVVKPVPDRRPSQHSSIRLSHGDIDTEAEIAAAIGALAFAPIAVIRGLCRGRIIVNRDGGCAVSMIMNVLDDALCRLNGKSRFVQGSAGVRDGVTHQRSDNRQLEDQDDLAKEFAKRSLHVESISIDARSGQSGKCRFGPRRDDVFKKSAEIGLAVQSI